MKVHPNQDGYYQQRDHHPPSDDEQEQKKKNTSRHYPEPIERKRPKRAPL
jgi:hypothetical protein